MSHPQFIIRIDDRLIHGQVIVGWAKALNLNKIIVVNDKLLEDKLKIQMLKLAVPANINVEILSLTKAIDMHRNNSWVNDNSILLLESPKDAFEFVSGSCNVKKINVGGLHVQNNRRQLTQNIAVNEEDIYYLEKLLNEGIILEGRALPFDEEYKVKKALDKNHNGKH